MTTIKEIAQKHGISNRELARRCGIPIRTVENWSSGATAPPEYMLKLIESHLERVEDDMRADYIQVGIITVEDFEKAVAEFGFDHPVCTALWNTMSNNPRNSEEFETVYAFWATGKYKEAANK